MELESFLPKYPNIHKLKGSAFVNPYPPDRPFNEVIVNKKEFKDLTLTADESLPSAPGGQLNHQKIITRFLASQTPYDELLLFHDMGTGKTCTAISVIENIRYTKKTPYRGAMIFTRSVPLGKNFINELLFKCTDGRYIPEHYERLTDVEKVRRVNKIVSDYYEFLTFEVFAKTLKSMTDEEIKAKYNNLIIVIDEVHNIRLKESEEEDLDIYNEFFRFLHLMSNRKVLLLSGTPMKDHPSEIASVMNLILPPELQFAPHTFTKDYFNADSTIKPGMKADLEFKLTGRVSYLKAMSTSVQKVFMGETLGGLRFFKVTGLKMSEFQTKYYKKAYKKDKEEQGVFSYSRQASLFTYPDGTYGAEGFEQDRYILKRKQRVMLKTKKESQKTSYFMGPELAAAIDHDVSNVYKYGCKYGFMLETILAHQGKSFAYCEYVNGSGLILLGLLLDHFGYSKATGTETTRGKRYALLSYQTSTHNEILRLIARYNQRDNVDGEYIAVVIGSRVISEGITLRNVVHEFILTPHWNYSETAQVIARGWRVGAHSEMRERGDVPKVFVYQEAALPNSKKVPSIDLDMYKISENKDVAIKQIEHVIKKIAFDCPLNQVRNTTEGMDGMRECEYTSCDYTCSGTFKEDRPTDDITYNLYYATSDEVHRTLTAYFKTNFSIQLAQLQAILPKSDKFAVAKAVVDLINSDVQFKNMYGFDCYLRERGDTIYMTLDPGKTDEYLTEYYTKNILLTKEVDYEQMVVDIYVHDLPKRINDMFTHPHYLRVMITALPDYVQIMLLQAAIVADLKRLDKNASIRQDILSYFKGFYGQVKGKWTVWYVHETEGTTCFNETTQLWEPCELNEEDLKEADKKELLKSPIGYIGLYNPKIDEFCIRDVSQQRPSDLRKLTVGKRCKDWKVRDLVMIADRMKLMAPDSFLKGSTRKELQHHAGKLKQFHGEDLEEKSSQDLKRMIYFAKSRATTCDRMKDWFSEQNLLKEDLDCGHQTKKRFRIM